jgi:hypothetical protein
MKKDDQIRIVINKELKDKFKIACDGRTFTNVIIKLMEEYINDWNISNNKQK